MVSFKASTAHRGTDLQKTLNGLTALAQTEIENAKAVLSLVDFDSRLSFVLRMEHMCDRSHLKRKIGVMERIMEKDIAELRENGCVKKTTRMDSPPRHMTDPKQKTPRTGRFFI